MSTPTININNSNAPNQNPTENSNIRERIRPIISQMCLDIVLDKPSNITLYMIKWLQNYGGYSSNSLTIDEKSELTKLREELKKYRKYEEHENNFKDDNFKDPKNKNKKMAVNVPQDENEEEEEEKEDSDVDFDLDDDDYIKKHVALKPRRGICGKVHGTPHPKKPDENKKKPNANNKDNDENNSNNNNNKFNDDKKQESSFKPKIYQKSPEIKEKIKTNLLKSILFNNLDQKDLDVIINAMEEKKFPENTEIVKQNEITENVYLVYDGKLEAYKSFDKTPHLVKEIQKGDLFNEISVLYNHKNPATIKTINECTLFTLDRNTYVNILKEVSKNKNIYNENILNKIEIFSTLEPNELNLLANNIKISNYHKGDYIFHSGEYGDVFYYIEKGKLFTYKKTEAGKLEQKEKELNEKEYFGEKALINGCVRENSIIVASDTATLIGIDKETVNNLIGPMDEILKRNPDVYNKYIPNNNEIEEIMKRQREEEEMKRKEEEERKKREKEEAERIKKEKEEEEERIKKEKEEEEKRLEQERIEEEERKKRKKKRKRKEKKRKKKD